MLEPSLGLNPYYSIVCIQLSCSTATLPIIHSLGVALSLFLGAEARSFQQFIRLIFCSTCMLEPRLGVNPYYYIKCILLSCSTATLPIIHSLGVALSLFLGAEARSFDKFIRLISCNTCMLEPSLGLNPYYYILCIQLSCFTATLPIIHSLGVALSLFLGAEARSFPQFIHSLFDLSFAVLVC